MKLLGNKIASRLRARWECRIRLNQAREQNQRLQAAYDRVVEQRGDLQSKVSVLRTKVDAHDRKLRAELQAEVRILRTKIAAYERRHLAKNVDALAHNRESSMDDFFAEIEDESPYRRFGSALRVELQSLGVSFDAQRVVDVGVGPGFALQEMLLDSRPKSVVGYDFSSTALTHAKRALPDGRFERRGIHELPDEQFDIVICTEVLEHLEEPEKALQEVVRLVGVGGSLVLTVPDGRIDYSAKHINFWSPESWGLFLRRCLPTFEIRTSTFSPYPETGHQTNLGLATRR